MYSGENSGFDLKDLIVKVLFLVFFILILMWLYPKMPNIQIFYDKVYSENITGMKETAFDYYTNERLPKNVGDVSEMSLQKMLDLKLMVPFVDKEGNSCDTQNSYVKVTKEENEYVMKVTLVCGDQNDYIVDYIGCHDVCEDKLCIEDKTKEKTKITKTTNTVFVPVVPITKKYTVKVKVINGTTSRNSMTVSKGNSASAVVKAKTGYEFGTVSCTNGQKGTWSNNTLKVRNVTASTTCTVKFVAESNKYAVKVAVINGTSNVKIREVVLNGTTTFTISANNGYDINRSAVTCTDSVKGTMSGSTLIVNKIKDNGACVVTLGKTESSTKYRVNVQVVNGNSNVSSKVISKGGSDSFVITPNSGYSFAGSTVSCGSGVNGSLSNSYLNVSNVQANASCVVILKAASSYAFVSKTYYSVAYVSKTGTLSYTMNLNTLPTNVKVSDVKATSVSIAPMSGSSDFNKYVSAKQEEEMTMIGGNNGASISYYGASTLQAHALNSSNFSVYARSGCTTNVCSVVISDNVVNLNGVNPTGTVTLLNGTKASGLYYVPVKMVVTFKYEK